MGYQVQSRRRRRSLRPSGDEATRKFRVSRLKGLGFTVGDWGFRLKGSGFRVQGLGFRIQGSGFRVQCSGFRVQGLGFRI